MAKKIRFGKKREEKKEETEQEKQKEKTVYETEINIFIENTNFIETFYTNEKKVFKYNNKDYNLEPYGMILVPLKNGFRPVYYFKENHNKPIDFTNKNKNIPARVISLLYNFDTYRILIEKEFKKMNLILVILSIVILVILCVYGYVNFTNLPIPWVR